MYKICLFSLNLSYFLYLIKMVRQRVMFLVNNPLALYVFCIRQQTSIINYPLAISAIVYLENIFEGYRVWVLRIASRNSLTETSIGYITIRGIWWIGVLEDNCNRTWTEISHMEIYKIAGLSNSNAFKNIFIAPARQQIAPTLTCYFIQITCHMHHYFFIKILTSRQ